MTFIILFQFHSCFCFDLLIFVEFCVSFFLIWFFFVANVYGNRLLFSVNEQKLIDLNFIFPIANITQSINQINHFIFKHSTNQNETNKQTKFIKNKIAHEKKLF
jgi:hypothetical protein